MEKRGRERKRLASGNRSFGRREVGRQRNKGRERGREKQAERREKEAQRPTCLPLPRSRREEGIGGACLLKGPFVHAYRAL